MTVDVTVTGETEDVRMLEFACKRDYSKDKCMRRRNLAILSRATLGIYGFIRSAAMSITF